MIKELCHHFDAQGSYSAKLVRDTFGQFSPNNKEKIMLEESFLKTNFMGRDGFRWWVDKFPEGEDCDLQQNGGGWGNRIKVRILVTIHTVL